MRTRQWRWWAGEQPERQGYAETEAEALRELSRWVDFDLADAVTADGANGETYYYADQDACDRDSDGAYAPMIQEAWG